MSGITEIVYIVLPVFLVIGLGFSLKRTNLVSSDFLFQLNRLIFYVALPALLFHKISSADFSASFNPALLLGMLVSMVLVFGLSYLYTVIRKYPAEARGAFSQGAFRGNLAYIGLAIVFNAYGEQGFAVAGILIGILVPVLNLLAVIALLLPQEDEKHSLGAAFWAYQFVFNPLVIACFVGIVWSFLGFSVPVVLGKALDIVTGMSLPLALIAIGASFSPQKLRGELAKAFFSTGIKIIWMPVLTAAVLLLLGVRGMELAVGVLLAGTPTATSAYIMAQQLKSDAELSGAIIMMSTVLSVFTYSFFLFVLKAWGI